MFQRHRQPGHFNEAIVSPNPSGDEHLHKLQYQYLSINRTNQVARLFDAAPPVVPTGGKQQNQRERGSVGERLNEHSTLRRAVQR